jgi:hypothetical protein
VLTGLERGPQVREIDRPLLAVGVAIALPYLAFFLGLNSIEPPTREAFAPLNEHSRGAFVFRDNVSGMEKLGSKLLARSQLRPAYDELVYVTQRADRRHFDESELLEPLRGLLQRHAVVDIFLFAHGNGFVEWIVTLPEELRQRIRLVYNTGCGGASQDRRWLAIGADAYVGHPGRSASSLFCLYFTRRWARGWSLERAVSSSNDMSWGRVKVMKWLGLDSKKEDLWLGTRAELSGDLALRVGDPR